MEQVVLVDAEDNDVGVCEKMEAHRTGVLHRAFSVFVFNTKGEVLLQQRAYEKYHSGGLWTNTCCSHPRLGEAVADAADRRMHEEMGFSLPLEHRFHFTYKAQLGDLIEHELDHVFTGVSDTEPVPNPAEVVAWRYMSPDDLTRDMKEYPERYTAWIKIAWAELVQVIA